MGERVEELTSYICISSNVPLGIFDLGRYDLVHMSYFSGPASCNWSWERTGTTWNYYMFSRRHNMRDFITGRIMKDHRRLTYIWLLCHTLISFTIHNIVTFRDLQVLKIVDIKFRVHDIFLEWVSWGQCQTIRKPNNSNLGAKNQRPKTLEPESARC